MAHEKKEQARSVPPEKTGLVIRRMKKINSMYANGIRGSRALKLYRFLLKTYRIYPDD